MAARTAGRKGRPWRRVRQQVLAEHAGICGLCGHGGARYVDHRIPIGKWRAMGGDPNDPANLQPAHGALNKCAECGGKACNESKGDRPYRPKVAGSRDW